MCEPAVLIVVSLIWKYSSKGGGSIGRRLGERTSRFEQDCWTAGGLRSSLARGMGCRRKKGGEGESLVRDDSDFYLLVIRGERLFAKVLM
jgi:hypothetical protein